MFVETDVGRTARYLTNVLIPSLQRVGPSWVPSALRRVFFHETTIQRRPDQLGGYDSFPAEDWFFINGILTDSGMAGWNADYLARIFHRSFTIVQNATARRPARDAGARPRSRKRRQRLGRRPEDDHPRTLRAVRRRQGGRSAAIRLYQRRAWSLIRSGVQLSRGTTWLRARHRWLSGVCSTGLRSCGALRSTCSRVASDFCGRRLGRFMIERAINKPHTRRCAFVQITAIRGDQKRTPTAHGTQRLHVSLDVVLDDGLPFSV
jgi:hypothetical protein